MSIRIRRLCLLGASKNYDVSFLDSEQELQPLSTVAGEISTGKTSVLEFIDYCLGASRHPSHIEIRRQARSALLEVELSGETAVIERPLFSTDQVAHVHSCSIDELEADQPHHRSLKVLEPARDENSLSMFLLGHVGLAGIALKEAPTQESSPMQPLSFRDVMWLCFLPNTRLDNKQLLHEHQFMERLKLRQVIEVIFDVHDDQAARLSDQLRETEDLVRNREAEIEALARFLTEEQVAEPMELSGRLNHLTARDRELTDALDFLTQRMRAESRFADELRRTYAQRQQEANQAATVVRYQETLLRRLTPLQSQYAEDESKLYFYEEARALFDPLRVQVCPSCFQDIQAPLQIDHGECSLCGRSIPRQEDEQLDVRAELAAIRSRRREIEKYLNDVQDELAAARIEHGAAQEAEATAQRSLDDAVTRTLSPYIGQRERLVSERETIRAERGDLQRQLGWRDSLEQRRTEVQRLQGQATELRRRLRDIELERRSKADVVDDLTTRFTEILQRFDYPKLDDPEPPMIDAHFVPHVRGTVYREIGSSGALTLISLAWQLAIFERAVELGHPHPGFLMIDSPQKNLTPKEEVTGDDFMNPQIALNVWSHLSEWSQSFGRHAQLIIVDNHPPEEVGKTVVARYGGKYGPPPYGLIDNETT